MFTTQKIQDIHLFVLLFFIILYYIIMNSLKKLTNRKSTHISKKKHSIKKKIIKLTGGDIILRKQYQQIFKSFKKYHPNFNKSISNRITEYEAAIGFTEATRVGSRQFNIKFGEFMEDVYDTSVLFTKLPQTGAKGGNDGESSTTMYECKSRHDTMKGSTAVKEISTKLDYAIQVDKDFILLILTDRNNISRDIPLHKGCSLKKITTVDGYDPEKHRWISGDNVYIHLFGSNANKIKKFIIDLLYQTSSLHPTTL